METKILNKKIIKTNSKWSGKIFLANKVIIRFEMDKKGWEQWGASRENLILTVPIVEKYWNEFVAQ